MKQKFSRILFSLVFLFLILIIGGIVLGVHFTRRAMPIYDGSEKVQGISAPVRIDRDQYAIPHISAATDEEAYLGLGYVHASDRLFQMEMMRRVGEGRISAMLGKKGYVIDVFAKTVGFRRIADEMWRKASPETKRTLTAYSNGVNAFIQSHQGKFGFEFDALTIEPVKWEPQECLMIGRLMAWEMNFGYWMDGAFGDIALAIDSAHLNSLFPDYPDYGATVLEGASPLRLSADWTGSDIPLADRIKTAPTKTTGVFPARPGLKPSPAVTPQQQSARKFLEQFFAEHRKMNDEVNDLLERHPSGGGSNAFVLAPSRTTTGGAILENDTHLALSQPARWHVAHMRSDQGMNVAGFCVPGMPVFIIGRNPDLAWGVTNTMADESDFFIEMKDSTGLGYLTPNGPKKFGEIIDTIVIRDSDITLPSLKKAIAIATTIHGPVMSAVHPYRLMQHFQNDKRAGGIPRDTTIFEHSGLAISLAWNGATVTSDEFGAVLQLHRAKTIASARQHLVNFATPCLNMMFAERSGKTAYQFIGRMPTRSGNEHSILLPRRGWEASEQWTGFTTMTNLPSLLDPARGYIVSANNPATKVRTLPISNEWEPSSRADRISALIESFGKLDRNKTQLITIDVTSPYDRDIVMPYLLRLYPDPHPLTIKADSISRLRLDSAKRSWKRDSILRMIAARGDSLVKFDPLDTVLQPQIQSEAHRDSIKYDQTTERVLEYVRNWDGGMRAEEIGPTVYSVFLDQLIRNTFYDELGEERFREFIYLQNVPLRTLEKILPDSANIWWDVKSTYGAIPETRDSIIKRSLQQALKVLRSSFGRDIRGWQWGRLHTLTYKHQFSSAGPQVARLVDVETGGAAGGPTTVVQANYHFWAPYKMTVGPSQRMVVDMTRQSIFAMLPTGNAGNPLSENYRDMVNAFKAGQLIEIPLNGEVPLTHRFELLPSY